MWRLFEPAACALILPSLTMAELMTCSVVTYLQERGVGVGSGMGACGVLWRSDPEVSFGGVL